MNVKPTIMTISKALTGIMIILLTFASSLRAQDILLVSSKNKNNFGIPSTEYMFDVSVNGIPTRKMNVNAFVKPGAKGTVILSAGGKGRGYYSSSYGDTAKDLIDSLYSNNLDVYELRYEDENGWAEHCEGIGSYHQAVGIYSSMVKYLFDKFFENKSMVFATGNSGGSFQIAFGLAEFAMDSIFDMVILTGGPPISDLKRGIFGDSIDPVRWPAGVRGGTVLTDYLMGWTAEGYCVSRNAPDSIIDVLDTVSLYSRVADRTYDYKTVVNFVESDDPTNSHLQARLYFDTIQSQKAWYYLDDVKLHAVPSSPEGANIIRDLILGFISTNATTPQILNEQYLRANPNPSSNMIRFESNSKIEQLEIFTAAGRSIFQASSSIINVIGFPPGIYLACATNYTGQKMFVRFIKQ